jgi:hypothetical protein
MKYLLFLMLRMLRPFLRVTMALLAGFCLLMTLTLLILSSYRGWPEPWLWDAGVAFLISFLCLAIGWCYDALLLKLTPEGYVLIL